MENNLYYTPELKDLHYGFEFEYKSKDDNWVKVTLDTWNRPSKDNHLKYFTEHDLLRTLNHQDMACKYADLTCIRVKYLDKSDIESLGWINTENLEFTKDTWILRKFEDGIIIHNDYSNGKYKFPWLYEDSTDKIFEGTIKNRSELIKLMQQLNIK